MSQPQPDDKAVAPVAPPAAEAKPADAAPKVETEAEKSARFALLAKKEKALVGQKQAFASERDSFAKEKGSLLSELESFRKQKEEAKRNPAAFLRNVYGDSWYDTLTEVKLSGEKATPETVASLLEEKLSTFEQRLEQKEKQREEAAAKAREEARAQAREELHAEVTDLVAAHPDDYELISLTNAHGMVTQAIENEYQKSGKVLSAKEAADSVEKQIEEQVKKLQAAKRFATASPQPEGDAKQTTNAKPRALSNDITASAAALNGKVRRTEAERLQAALARLG